MRIALISLYDHHAFGVRSLYSVLKKNNVKSYCIFYKYFAFEMKPSTDKEINSLVGLLKELSVDAIGISVTSSFFKEAAKLTKKLKGELDKIIIWGGVHPTIMPEKCIEIADYIFIGEAERSLLEFINLRKGPEKKVIPGVWSREGGKIKKGPPLELVDDLDCLPITDFSNDAKYYIEEGKVFHGDPLYDPENFAQFYEHAYPVLASRGCPFNCSYCCSHILNKMYEHNEGFIRRRGMVSLIRELKYAKEYLHAKKVLFYDACFASDFKWLLEFCDLYKKEIDLPFYCEMHPDIVNEKVVSRLCNAGLFSSSVGLQSGSERIRTEFFNRPISNDELREKAELFRKYNIALHYELITDNPFENEKDKEQTLDLLFSLPRPLRLNIFSLNFFPKAKITESALNRGLIEETDIEGESSRGLSQFMLKYPGDGKDTLWNYIYFLASDYYCSSGDICGLRGVFSDNLTLFLSRSNFIKKNIFIFSKICDLIRMYVLLEDKICKLFKLLKQLLPRRPLLFLQIFALSIIFPILINFMATERLFLVLNIRKKRINSNSDKIGSILKYASFIMKLWPWHKLKNICFIRSVLLYYFLRSEGLGVKINFGIRKEGEALKGHSWLILDNEVYMDDSDILNKFEVIYTFPCGEYPKEQNCNI